MAILNILEFPDPRLRNRAEPVASVDESIQRLLDDMLETMYEAEGVGLAATQINAGKRIVVIDISEEKDSPQCFINPEIFTRGGVTESEEGCLSVPGFSDTIKRAEMVEMRALDRQGKPVELRADGLLAICLQHEIDHLDGKLFVDYLSPLKRQRIRKKLEKTHRLRGDADHPVRTAL
jgi:peptide deformylase